MNRTEAALRPDFSIDTGDHLQRSKIRDFVRCHDARADGGGEVFPFAGPSRQAIS